MRIKIVDSIRDEKGVGVPPEMIGSEYDVIKQDQEGVWVNNGKIDVLVYFKELQITDLGSDLSTIFYHYLKDTPKDKFQTDLQTIGCNHLL